LYWQERILNRLNIQKGYSKLILDKTGLLVHRKFIAYLKSCDISYVKAQTLPEILSSLKQKCLILSLYLQPPSYLQDKIEIFIFDYNQLPVEIDYTIAQSLTVDKLILLLTYHTQNNAITCKWINEYNINDEISKAEKYDKDLYLKELTKQLDTRTKSISHHNDILFLGKLWGEYIYNCFKTHHDPDENLMIDIDKNVEKAIFNGCAKNAFYAAESDFKTVEKIRAYIKSKNLDRAAILCFDGLGVAEWMLLKEYLCQIDLSFSEKYIFALIPTITTISRSAIFYGDCISVYNLNTPNETKEFKKFFNTSTCFFYREGNITGESSLLGVDIAVIIYNVFDDIAHETKIAPYEKTKSTYFKNVNTYLEKSSIIQELRLLKTLGYTIFICSDHGCVLGEGNGQRIDKYLIETSTKRATLITKSELSKFYDVNHYEIPFISDEKVALLAKKRTIFAPDHLKKISHGGVTLEELIIPFVEVK